MRNSWWLDAKLGLRMLVKYPGLAIAGGAGIAVAVAIATGAYSFIYSNYLAIPLPFEEGNRIVSLQLWDTAANDTEARIVHDFRAWREELKTVEEISAYRLLSTNLITTGSRPETVRVAAMSASGFRVARVPPRMGRYLREEDEFESAPAVVVIGEDVWRNRFGGDAGVLERSLQLGSTAYSIVGVMPKEFAFPINDHIWVPLRTGAGSSEPLMGPELTVFGRLAEGVSVQNAEAELTSLIQREAAEFPQSYTRLRPQVMPYASANPDDVPGLIAMQGLMVSLLVLVCLNVAILVYTRTAMRQAEISLRTALGASRARIVGQLFMEALVLSGVAAFAGVGFAALSLRQVEIATLPLASTLPFWVSFRLSPQAVAYAVALSVVAAMIVGIVPALQATRRRLQTGFRVAGAEGMRMGKTWTILIVAQVGFAVALLPPAVSSAWEDARDGMAGLGFPAEQFLSAQLGMDSATGATPARFAGRQTELIGRLQAEPQVSSVTFSMSVPGDERGGRIEIESGASAQSHAIRFNRVDVNYFRVFEVPLLAGRGFEAADTGAATAVVVNQPFAQKVFGGDALGKRIRYLDHGPSQQADPARWYEIVGIVADFPTGVSQGMRDTNARIYHAAAAGEVEPASLAIRLRGGSPVGFSQSLRDMAGAVDPDLHLLNIRGLDDAVKSEQWISRLTASIYTAITFSVLLLSSAGIYALMSFTVSQRRREIGIRLALGADRAQIIANIFSRAFAQLAAGACVGLALGIFLEKASAGVLLRGNASVVLPGVTLLIVAVGVLAALGPTRRSLRIDPTEALREQ